MNHLEEIKIIQQMSDELYEYLERVRTYKLGKWLYRSSKLSPYVLASRGFQAVSPTIAQCHICQTQVNFQGLSVSQDVHPLQQQLLIQITFHREDCVYRAPQQTLFKLSRQQLYGEMDSILKKLTDTYKFYKGKLPFITENIWNKYFGKNDQFFNKFSDKFGEGKDVSLPFLLGIFGWQLEGKDKPCLECLFCGRTVLIENFATNDGDRQKIINERILTEHQKMFDPVEQHRYFCFWGNVDEIVSEHHIQELFGWQICVKHLQDKSLEAERGWTRSNKFEQVAKAKQQFAKILDNFTAKTKETMSKFSELLNQSKSLALQEGENEGLREKAENTRQSLESIMKELDEVRSNKKVKLV